MSSLLLPTRTQRYQPYGHSSSRGISPYYGQSRPVSLSHSLWTSSDPFSFAFDQPFHQPFVSLFNDTFSQLDRLTNELSGHLNTALSNQEGSGNKTLTWTPKFDIKETDQVYVLEGEMPGVKRENVGIEWADNSTLIVKGRIASYREEGEKVKEPTPETTGALPDSGTGEHKDTSAQATPNDASTSTDEAAVTTTNASKDIVKQTHQPTYHLTERTVGNFQRVFSFPGKVQHDIVKASLKNGLLTVTVPKVIEDAAEKVKPRSVEIEEVKDEGDAVKEADEMQA